MTSWLKIGEDIIDCIKSEHQLSIDNEWVNSYFTIDCRRNSIYFNIIFDLYNNKRTFNWEDNKSRGFISTIKSIDVMDSIITCQFKSKNWGVKNNVQLSDNQE